MCKAASFKVTREYKALFHPIEDSHSKIECHEGVAGAEPNFVPVEISPPDGNLSRPFKDWVFSTDMSIKDCPSWYDPVRAEKVCREELPNWAKKLEGVNLKEAFNPVNPLHLPTAELTEKHKEALKKWASVLDSVGASVWVSVRDSVVASVGDSVWVSVVASVRASVGDSVYGYIGSLFPNIKKWEGTGLENPWDSISFLWYSGYIPSFDGKIWRLHCGENAKVAWEWNPNE